MNNPSDQNGELADEKGVPVVQDTRSCQRLLALADGESLEFLRRSLEAADAGHTRPLRKAVESLLA